jgi:hypothetical protein
MSFYYRFGVPDITPKKKEDVKLTKADLFLRDVINNYFAYLKGVGTGLTYGLLPSHYETEEEEIAGQIGEAVGRIVPYFLGSGLVRLVGGAGKIVSSLPFATRFVNVAEQLVNVAPATLYRATMQSVQSEDPLKEFASVVAGDVLSTLLIGSIGDIPALQKALGEGLVKELAKYTASGLIGVGGMAIQSIAEGHKPTPVELAVGFGIGAVSRGAGKGGSLRVFATAQTNKAYEKVAQEIAQNIHPILRTEVDLTKTTLQHLKEFSSIHEAVRSAREGATTFGVVKAYGKKFAEVVVLPKDLNEEEAKRIASLIYYTTPEENLRFVQATESGVKDIFKTPSEIKRYAQQNPEFMSDIVAHANALSEKLDEKNFIKIFDKVSNLQIDYVKQHIDNLNKELKGGFIKVEGGRGVIGKYGGVREFSIELNVWTNHHQNFPKIITGLDEVKERLGQQSILVFNKLKNIKDPKEWNGLIYAEFKAKNPTELEYIFYDPKKKSVIKVSAPYYEGSSVKESVEGVVDFSNSVAQGKPRYYGGRSIYIEATDELIIRDFEIVGNAKVVDKIPPSTYARLDFRSNVWIDKEEGQRYQEQERLKNFSDPTRPLDERILDVLASKKGYVSLSEIVKLTNANKTDVQLELFKLQRDYSVLKKNNKYKINSALTKEHDKVGLIDQITQLANEIKEKHTAGELNAFLELPPNFEFTPEMLGNLKITTLIRIKNRLNYLREYFRQYDLPEKYAEKFIFKNARVIGMSNEKLFELAKKIDPNISSLEEIKKWDLNKIDELHDLLTQEKNKLVEEFTIKLEKPTDEEVARLRLIKEEWQDAFYDTKKPEQVGLAYYFTSPNNPYFNIAKDPNALKIIELSMRAEQDAKYITSIARQKYLELRKKYGRKVLKRAFMLNEQIGDYEKYANDPKVREAQKELLDLFVKYADLFEIPIHKRRKGYLPHITLVNSDDYLERLVVEYAKENIPDIIFWSALEQRRELARFITDIDRIVEVYTILGSRKLAWDKYLPAIKHYLDLIPDGSNIKHLTKEYIRFMLGRPSQLDTLTARTIMWGIKKVSDGYNAVVNWILRGKAEEKDIDPNVIKLVEEQGDLATLFALKYGQRPLTRIVGFINSMQALAKLSFNLVFSLKNLWQTLTNTFPEVSTKNFFRAIVDYVFHRNKQLFADGVHAFGDSDVISLFRLKGYDDRSIQTALEIAGVLTDINKMRDYESVNKFLEVISKVDPAEITERFNKGVAFLARLYDNLDKGMAFDEAFREAQFFAYKAQFTGSKAFSLVWQRNPIGRFLMLFMSYPVKQTEYFFMQLKSVQELFAQGKTNEAWSKLGKLAFAYGSGIALSYALGREILDFVPYQFVKSLYRLATDEDFQYAVKTGDWDYIMTYTRSGGDLIGYHLFSPNITLMLDVVGLLWGSRVAKRSIANQLGSISDLIGFGRENKYPELPTILPFSVQANRVSRLLWYAGFDRGFEPRHPSKIPEAVVGLFLPKSEKQRMRELFWRRVVDEHQQALLRKYGFYDIRRAMRGEPTQKGETSKFYRRLKEIDEIINE